jgi:hypothetical protein
LEPPLKFSELFPDFSKAQSISSVAGVPSSIYSLNALICLLSRER